MFQGKNNSQKEAALYVSGGMMTEESFTYTGGRGNTTDGEGGGRKN